ncbi:alpha-amylase family glycosyl hydrolase [Haploplasma axanthum]|uniref:Alpha-1,4-glucan:maltose-1-phosphate maltosyltransferase 2 n=1 Tax=Haploplasma axanthum TaxID=29552 RepID=A0A449BFC8_HAPAX|nr:alpha-amylase family glycosyl hydrolase [Haploplasma axanthum]VEU81125.1 Alpha-1,4-glucan:maltose-1-phosphate maltosyltransferase 2 [Haploplasma axanthum]
MAKQTKYELRNKSIYQVFIRQHSKTQDFKGVIKDLDRIKSMGFDIVYLLPFHPIGKVARKGSVGSPYSIMDYYAIDSLHGTLDDFLQLKMEVNKRGMLLMMDIVFNHTSRDSKLVKEHPKWFYKNEKGEFANRVGDWSDITDFDFSNKKLWKYLIDVLKYWSTKVDGFRCDVAPLIPIDFWIEARMEVDKLNSNLIWLTESVELGFIKYIRDLGFDASSDSMMYDAFDICYDYDIFKFMDGFLEGKNSLSRWLEEIIKQEMIYPKNYIKARSFENHDQERIASKVKSKNQLVNLVAMQFFLRGVPFIYAGGEYLNDKRPNLFENDLINWNKENSIESLIKKLNELNKEEILSTGVFDLVCKDFAMFSYKKNDRYLLGVFNLEDKLEVRTPLKDGTYLNLLNNKEVNIKNSIINDLKYPIIIDTRMINLK